MAPTTATAIKSPTKEPESFLWRAGEGEKVITCEDRDGHFTARFALPPNDSDPLVRELNTILAQLDQAAWNTIVVSVDTHSTWPEVDEGDYFKHLRLKTPTGTTTLDHVDNGPGVVLREAGALSSGSSRQQAQDLLLRMRDRGAGNNPEVFYITTKDLPDIQSATAGFPSAGKPCTN